MAYSWSAHDLVFLTCSWHVLDLLMTYSWLVHYFLMFFFITCSWFVHSLLITCSWLCILDLFMSCPWLPNDLITTSWLSSLDLSITWSSCVHDFYDLLMTLQSFALRVNDFFMTYYLRIILFINCLFMTFPWLVHNVFTFFSYFTIVGS